MLIRADSRPFRNSVRSDSPTADIALPLIIINAIVHTASVRLLGSSSRTEASEKAAHTVSAHSFCTVMHRLIVNRNRTELCSGAVVVVFEMPTETFVVHICGAHKPRWALAPVPKGHRYQPAASLNGAINWRALPPSPTRALQPQRLRQPSRRRTRLPQPKRLPPS